MFRRIIIALCVLAACACALDRIWDTRYTFGPEFPAEDRFSVGTGFYTTYNEDGTIPTNIQIGINDQWEMGGKIFFSTHDKLESVQAFADVGAKYKFQELSTVGADFLVGVNNGEGGGVVFSYMRKQPLSDNFSNIVEGRAGFFHAVAGKGGYMKLALGATPQLYLGTFIHAMMGVEASGSIGNIKEDFMVDIVPRIEVNVKPYLHFTGELAIGILQGKNNDNTRAGIYGRMDF